MDKLLAQALKSLKANMIPTSEGKLLVAGQNHFRTLWTRDFCFSVPGLLLMGEKELVRRQLTLIWEHQREDGLLPRGMDVIPPQFRVLVSLLLRRPLDNYKSKKIKPEFLGEHGTPAIDSNLLMILATLDYSRHAEDDSFALVNEPQFKKALSYYTQFLQDGLISQPEFSDWQDSLKRNGPQLYTNLLYRKVLKLRSSPEIVAKLEDQIISTFLIHDKWKEESFEAMLWLLEDPLPRFEFTLKDFLLIYPTSSWGIPNPKSLVTDISWTTRVVGLAGYHRTYKWSWLLGEATRVIRKLDPVLAQEAFNIMTKLFESSESISEIYDREKPFHGKLYRSEEPFSWGSAKVIEACLTK